MSCKGGKGTSRLQGKKLNQANAARFADIEDDFPDFNDGYDDNDDGANAGFTDDLMEQLLEICLDGNNDVVLAVELTRSDRTNSTGNTIGEGSKHKSVQALMDHLFICNLWED